MKIICCSFFLNLLLFVYSLLPVRWKPLQRKRKSPILHLEPRFGGHREILLVESEFDLTQRTTFSDCFIIIIATQNYQLESMLFCKHMTFGRHCKIPLVEARTILKRTNFFLHFLKSWWSYIFCLNLTQEEGINGFCVLIKETKLLKRYNMP